MKLLIVEDEIPLANGLKFNFEQEGYDVVLATDGSTAVERFRQADPPFDLVILDLMLPSTSGYDACRSIREVDKDVPVLVLSARRLSNDKAQAFDCGTDQYMTKPFALPELLSRVRNLLERHSSAQTSRSQPSGTDEPLESFDFGRVCIDFRRFELTVDGQTQSLTRKEQELLRYFIQHEDRVLSRAEILENVWGEPSEVTTRSIDNFVMRLRRLIEENPADPRHILSVRGTGYRFVAHPETADRTSA